MTRHFWWPNRIIKGKTVRQPYLSKPQVQCAAEFWHWHWVIMPLVKDKPVLEVLEELPCHIKNYFLLCLSRHTCKGTDLQRVCCNHVTETERIPVINHRSTMRATLEKQRLVEYPITCNTLTCQQRAQWVQWQKHSLADKYIHVLS